MSSSIIFARMSSKEVELVKEVAKLRGEDLSDFMRRAVKTELAKLGYLSLEEKKALGLST